MKNLPVVLLTAGLLAAHAAASASDAPSSVPAYAPIGMKSLPADLMLIYQGHSKRPEWTPEQFSPYVSWQDPRSGKEQWLFDGFLFLEFMDGMGHQFENGRNLAPARRQEWQWLLDRHFAEGRAIPALEQSCADAARRIGCPLRKRQVFISIPEPLHGQTNWGEIQGRALIFDGTADRLAACEWFIRDALSKWNRLAPKHLELGGFYWLAESTGPKNAALLPPLGESIRRQGKQFLWIPYWKAARAAEWKTLGFDAAYQQPNHFFHPDVPDSRLDEACAFARNLGMGVEMEFDARMWTQAGLFAPRFDAYLDAFAAHGASTNAIMAYYEGGGALGTLAKHAAPEQRVRWERLARWVAERQIIADKAAKK